VIKLKRDEAMHSRQFVANTYQDQQFPWLSFMPFRTAARIIPFAIFFPKNLEGAQAG